MQCLASAKAIISNYAKCELAKNPFCQISILLVEFFLMGTIKTI